ncbi:MAG: hypothetical protein KDE27_02355 [Planctomycetes bacterium]|nr:hypothetical protein [Planctomycetota bacterium]
MNPLVYDVLYRLLFVAHAVLAAEVAGGTLWLALRGLRAGSNEDPLAGALRDWLPFALGLAITFGVGPLLLLQILDGDAFYTANLLLSHRFMALLPALIVGFYLLYVQKTKWRWVRSRGGRLAVPLVALGCFGYTAFCWSTNHLLAQSEADWAAVYVEQQGYLHRDLPFRLAAFFGVGLQAVAVLAGWQSPALRSDAAGRRRLGTLAAIGAAVQLLALVLHPPVEGVTLLGASGLLVLGATVAVVAGLRRGWWPAATIALAVGVERLAALREAVRVARGGADRAEEYASAQGFALFVVTLAGVGAAIAFGTVRVRRELASRQPRG